MRINDIERSRLLALDCWLAGMQLRETMDILETTFPNINYNRSGVMDYLRHQDFASLGIDLPREYTFRE